MKRESKRIIEDNSSAEEEEEQEEAVEKEEKPNKKQRKDDNEDKAKDSKKKHQVMKGDDGSSFLELSQNRRLTVRKFKGSTLVDIREFYFDKKEEMYKPGKKGISLKVEDWDVLKEIVGDVDKIIDSL